MTEHTLSSSPGNLPRLRVASLVADWHAALALRVGAGELAPTTAASYRRGLGRFLDWAQAEYADAPPGEVTADTVRQWLASLRSDYKPGAVNAWYAGLRAFCSWAVGARRLGSNPCLDVRGARRKGTQERHSRKALTDAEMLRVLDVPDQSTPVGIRDYAMLCTMAYTGIRSVEAHRADLADLTTEGDRLVLYVLGKGRTEREPVVIAHERAQAAIMAWVATRGRQPGPLFTSYSNRTQGGRLSLPAIRATVKRYYNLAGVVGEGKTTHSLRHAAITSAIRNGAQLRQVRAMARHASVDVTMIYVHEVDRLQDPAEAYISYGK